VWISYSHNSKTGDNLWIRGGLYTESYPQNVDKVIPMLSLLGITFFTVDNLSPFPLRLSPFFPLVIHRFWHTESYLQGFQASTQAGEEKDRGWEKRGYPHIHSPYYYDFIIYFRKKEKKIVVYYVGAVDMWITCLAGKRERFSLLSQNWEENRYPNVFNFRRKK
jgi:hypothetical protein